MREIFLRRIIRRLHDHFNRFKIFARRLLTDATCAAYQIAAEQRHSGGCQSLAQGSGGASSQSTMGACLFIACLRSLFKSWERLFCVRAGRVLATRSTFRDDENSDWLSQNWRHRHRRVISQCHARCSRICCPPAFVFISPKSIICVHGHFYRNHVASRCVEALNVRLTFNFERYQFQDGRVRGKN